MSDQCFWDADIATLCDEADKRGKRAYCGTKNNYTDADIVALEQWAQERCTYLVYGKEVAKTGTSHLQIYMEFENTIAMKSICKKLFPMWLGYRRGTPKQAAGYCKKGNAELPKDADPPTQDYWFPRTVSTPGFRDEEHPWILGNEFGTISHQGKRSDLDDVVESICGERRTIHEIARAHPREFIKYNKGIRDLRSLMIAPRQLDTMPEVIVLWGRSQTGKTMGARDTYFPGIPSYTWTPQQSHWFDRYDGEDKIIFDEFRAQLPFATMLNILDRYECLLPFKGGFINIRASKFVITSPKPPHLWYDAEDSYDKLNQLQRRITTIYHCTSLGHFKVKWHDEARF